MKRVLVVIIIAGLSLFQSCEKLGVNSTDEKINLDLIKSVLTGAYTEHYGQFHLTKTRSKIDYSHLNLPELDGKFYDTGWQSIARVQFGSDSKGKADYVKVNSSTLDEVILSLDYYNYHSNNINLKFDGTNNLIEWKLAGNSYSTNISTNASDIEFTSPTFMQSINKNQDLTITWSTSSETNDYVYISLQGVLNTDSTATKVGYFQSDIVNDTGSYTIPSSELINFSEAKATLSITRGTYSEETHGNKTYLFVLSSDNAIQIGLN